MQIKSIFAAIICLLFTFITTAQTHNPYKDIGKKGKVLTLTHGEYDEFSDEDSIQRIGSALVNINTMKVVKLQLSKAEQRQLDNSQVSRFLSVDPLAGSFPYYTPYQYAGNMPIAAIDLDGLEQHVVIYYKDQNNATTKIQVRAIFSNDGTILDQDIHKVGETEHIAKGNVLVFEIKNEGTIKQSMQIVESRNKPDSKLTAEEQKIFDKYKKLEEEPYPPTETLVYPTEKKPLYESKPFESADTKTYNAKYGIVPKFNNVLLKPNTNISNFNGSNNYYYGGSSFSQGGQLGSELITSLATFADQLKNAKNVTSITINLNQAINANIGTSEFNTAHKYGQDAVNNMVTLLKNRLKGTGITVNAGTTSTSPNATSADLIKSGRPSGVNIQIN